jgi:tripartite-type tricarboxylate transporter receptor subunit TctC
LDTDVGRREIVVSALSLAIPRVARSVEGDARSIRPVRLLVAAPPGGPSDDLARMLAHEMTGLLGETMLVVNKPGAFGRIAAELVHRSAPDGRTLMLSWIGNATAPALMRSLPYDINTDFAHITQLVTSTNVLVVRGGLPVATCAQLIEHARAHPGLPYASAGIGSSGHLAMEMLRQRAGVAVRHVPYRGGVPALLDLLAGRVDMLFVNQDAVLPHLGSDRLRLLAVSSARRHPMFPHLPTIAETGFPGFEATSWAGLSAPGGTPSDVVARLHAAAVGGLRGPMKDKQESLGAQVIGSSPAEYAAFVRAESEKWARVIERAHIRA